MKSFYSNGKLLLTGEYAVLDGALSLALPTSRGQSLSVTETDAAQLRWRSQDEKGKEWFDGTFSLISSNDELVKYLHPIPNSDVGFKENGLLASNLDDLSSGSGEKRTVSETLSKILREAQSMNSDFLRDAKGYEVKTKLDFPRDWGLGSSSTLINNIAQWAEVDAYQLLWKAFSGSGYDIACAQHNRPVLYRLDNKLVDSVKSSKKTREETLRTPADVVPFMPIAHVDAIDFNPRFRDQLHFVHLNRKQNSRKGIARYRKQEFDKGQLVTRISEITEKTVSCGSLRDFEHLMSEHEALISNILQMPTVKKSLFPDFSGAIKSLGAWGGDFILATGNEEVPSYFKKKGFDTILSYSDMILAEKNPRQAR